jgi:23S rRNA U2552 (ribose-2'-O)-methylase RlmE/FtsJ
MQKLASLAEDIQAAHSTSTSSPSSVSSSSESVTTPVQRCVDLCAAPGSWSQVLQRVLYNGNEINNYDFSKKKKKVIAMDLQEMAPLEGVEMIKGDITSESVARQVIDYFHPHKADLVVSDGAPDVTGLHEIDEYMQAQLMFAVLSITTHILRTGGSFCAKIFRADCYSLLHDQLSIFFEYVTLIKPASSRAASAEHFVVGLKFRMPLGFTPIFVKPVELKKQSSDNNSDTGAQPMLVSADHIKTEDENGNGLNQLIFNYLHCGDLNGHQLVDKWRNSKQQKSQTDATMTSAQNQSFTRFLKY